jgi:xanthine dehydrogenase accessory factor
VTATGLLKAFGEWSAAGKPLVLASVFETAGSTYSKAGAQMLITDDGKFQGMLSGGCLEGDLAERARVVLETGHPQSVSYDLGSNDEELWGLGVGCDGLMKIFLQPLTPEAGYEPFTTMKRAFSGESEQVAATVIDSTIDELPAGATVVTINGELAFSDVDSAFEQQISAVIGTTLQARESASHEITTSAGNATMLFSLLQPAQRILVLGAGLDAEPVVRFAQELGWRVTIQDHRPAYIESGNFPDAELHCVAVNEISAEVELDRYAAVIVMSHHLASDRQYLSQLAVSQVPYIGLLGPIDRRRRLLDDLGKESVSLEGRLHGPAGIDIGGRGPASIALSIVAGIHQHLTQTGNL